MQGTGAPGHGHNVVIGAHRETMGHSVQMELHWHEWKPLTDLADFNLSIYITCFSPFNFPPLVDFEFAGLKKHYIVLLMYSAVPHSHAHSALLWQRRGVLLKPKISLQL